MNNQPENNNQPEPCGKCYRCKLGKRCAEAPAPEGRPYDSPQAQESANRRLDNAARNARRRRSYR